MGQTVRVRDDANQAETWSGQVLRVSDWFTRRRSVLQEPSEKNDVRTLECIVRLDANQRPLRLGQRVQVTFGVSP
jgi:hypothetical protein